ncbi:hypothetical protein [Natronorubrum texcoconense]|uniref:Uncharacterized protein n=1 Tax=Natronorubrum texcoconense TaxID=1095776 RepID=A0A1G8X536_9EURY|nr:hypothetical protein [Natronorubrum texcoconense]SDJ85738.1 hypothetical protein SAMN04515672_1623 [Natronorubrum texcoconense]
MGIIEGVGVAVAIAGVFVYLFPRTVFKLALFGMFAKDQLSAFGRRALKAIGAFLIFEGVLILSLITY